MPSSHVQRQRVLTVDLSRVDVVGVNWRLAYVVPRLHDQANIEQTSSKRRADVEQTSSKHRA